MLIEINMNICACLKIEIQIEIDIINIMRLVLLKKFTALIIYRKHPQKGYNSRKKLHSKNYPLMN